MAIRGCTIAESAFEASAAAAATPTGSKATKDETDSDEDKDDDVDDDDVAASSSKCRVQNLASLLLSIVRGNCFIGTPAFVRADAPAETTKEPGFDQRADGSEKIGNLYT